MFSKKKQAALVGSFVGLVLLAPAVFAQSSSSNEEYIPVDQIMSTAVRNISARYNLNEEQMAFTDALMRREVRAFLQDHHDEVWPVIRDIWDIQRGQKTLESQAARNIGSVAGPLFSKVKKAILDANTEWRECLTEQQRQVHDYDLKEMATTFEQIDDNLGKLKEGQTADGGIFPPARPLQNEPPRPEKPNTGFPGATVEVFNTSMFDPVVEAFIAKYDLEPGQIESARSILQEFKDDADKYLSNHKRELNKARRTRTEAISNGDLKAAQAAGAEFNGMLRPLHAMVDQMEGRLRNLLTQEQIGRSKESSTPTKKNG